MHAPKGRVVGFGRSIPPGPNSFAPSPGRPAAASVPSNGRYANEAVEPTMPTPITTTHIRDDEDLIFEIRRLIATQPLRNPFKAPAGTPTLRHAPTTPPAPREKAGPRTERNKKCSRLTRSA